MNKREVSHHENYFQAVAVDGRNEIRTWTVVTLAPNLHCITCRMGMRNELTIDPNYPAFAHRSEAEAVLDNEAVRLNWFYTTVGERGVTAHLVNEPKRRRWEVVTCMN